MNNSSDAVTADDDAPLHLSTGRDGSAPLWPGDEGTLPLIVRRVLVKLLKGPYVSHRTDPSLWSALLTHEALVRTHLADILLDLAVDADAEVAFARNISPGPEFPEAVPRVLRTASLSFIDTALLLHLRELHLRGAATGERVVIGRQELEAHLGGYSASSGFDQSTFATRVGASIKRMVDWSILLRTATEDRWEVSSTLGLVLTPELIGEIETEYRRLYNSAASDDAPPEGTPGKPDPAADGHSDEGQEQ